MNYPHIYDHNVKIGAKVTYNMNVFNYQSYLHSLGLDLNTSKGLRDIHARKKKLR